MVDMNARKQMRHKFMNEYHGFRVDVPEGKSGLWEVRRLEMTDRDVMIADAFDYVLKTDREAEAGIYTLLVEWGKNGNPYEQTVVMSDHLCEVADHAALVNYAKANAPLNHVLINGLGLGVAIELLMPYVNYMTIIEVEPKVIKLVAPHYFKRYAKKLEIIQHDALTYIPPTGTYYDAVFHDIWSYISRDNLEDMKFLHRRYGRLCDWQASWAREYCERDRRKYLAHPEEYENRLETSDVIKHLKEDIVSTLKDHMND